MRLGDLDALKADLIHDYAYAAASMVGKQPTIDAVPVVRCKDCKYWGHDPIDNECQCMYWKGLFDYCKPDDFCSYGERKDGDG